MNKPLVNQPFFTLTIFASAPLASISAFGRDAADAIHDAWLSGSLADGVAGVLKDDGGAVVGQYRLDIGNTRWVPADGSHGEVEAQ